MKQIFLLVLVVILVYASCSTGSGELPVTTWEYIEIDSSRAKWGDFDEPEWLRAFGLDMGDVNNDGMKDIISGRYIYLNPGDSMEGDWQRIDLVYNVDGIAFMDIDDDAFADAIALALPKVYWFEAENEEGTSWNAKVIADNVPATGHVNAQGYLTAEMVNGGKEEVLFTARDGIYMAEVPANPDTAMWKFIRVGITGAEEGFDVGDIDGDGDLDIICSEADYDDEWDRPLFLYWYENPGAMQPDWERTKIGGTINEADRIKIADFNGDGMMDFAVSEERYPGPDPDAHLYVFIGSNSNDSLTWKRNILVQQYSMNNLDAADIDNDGDIDLITNEHKGEEHKTELYINDGNANFTAVTIDTGIENHLGTQFSDMDGDGDLDIVGIGWDEYKLLHLWRNDAITE